MFKQFASELLGSSLKSEERLDAFSFYGSVQQDLLGTGLAEAMESLLAMARELPARDKFELHIEIDGGDPVVIQDHHESSIEKMRCHLSAIDYSSEVDVRFVVMKRAEASWISVYSLDDLAEHWAAQPLRAAVEVLWSRFEDGVRFECLESVDYFGSSSIGFYPKGSRGDAVPASDSRDAELVVFAENCYVQGLSGRWLPADFWLLKRSHIMGINDFFDRVVSALCVSFLANSSIFNEVGSLEYRLVGYKAISGSLSSAIASPALSSLYKIYRWAYGPGASSDRIGLARNVISLHVGDISEVTEDSGVWGAIQSNYQIYLKGNISAYLEVKSRIAELLVDASAKAHAVAQNLVVALKAGVATMAAFVLGVVVVNGVKDSGIESFFSLSYLGILSVVIVVFTIWVEHEAGSARRALQDSEAAFEEILTGGYSKIIHSSEIVESLNPIAIRNRTFLDGEIVRIRMVWAVICLIVFFAFLVGWFIYSPVPAPAPKTPDFVCYQADSVPKDASQLRGCLWPKFQEGASGVR